MAKWLEFKEIQKKPKTSVFEVINKETQEAIGIIKFYPPFRKYSYFPYLDTVYEETCQRDIADELGRLEAERKENARLLKEPLFQEEGAPLKEIDMKLDLIPAQGQEGKHNLRISLE
jgi:hypothetical protein